MLKVVGVRYGGGAISNAKRSENLKNFRTKSNVKSMGS